jgi:hypothetical protein
VIKITIGFFHIHHLFNKRNFWEEALLTWRIQFAIVVFLLLIASTPSSNAQEEIEDFIDIAESNGKIIAIIEGRKTIPLELGINETVLWSDSSGYLGAFLTNARFLVASTSSDAWQVLPLKLNESENGVASLSPNIALLVTGARAVGFDATSNRFVETPLPIHDELLAAQAEKTIAVVVTSSRAFGFAIEASTFADIHLRVKESIEEIKATSSKVVVRTSDRLLTFDANGSAWNEHKF